MTDPEPRDSSWLLAVFSAAGHSEHCTICTCRELFRTIRVCIYATTDALARFFLFMPIVSSSTTTFWSRLSRTPLMLSLIRSWGRTPYERLYSSTEPTSPSTEYTHRKTQSHALWYRLFSSRIASKRTRRNFILVTLSILSAVIVVVLVLYGQIIYRILELPSYKRYRDAENSRRPRSSGVFGMDGEGEGSQSAKYFFPAKRLIGASYTMDVRDHMRCADHYITTRGWVGKYSSRTDLELVACVCRQCFVRSSSPPTCSRTSFNTPAYTSTSFMTLIVYRLVLTTLHHLPLTQSSLSGLHMA